MVLLALLLAALAWAFSVVNVGSGAVAGGLAYTGAQRVELYYTCGVDSVRDWGVCRGDCLGFVAALSADQRGFNITVGGQPAEVVYAALYQLSDTYQPRLYVVVFRAKAAGPVKVSGLYRP
ncbi:hypothetical protein [Pyrobaculum sp.]|uniref:hypothetical protein n=1 Tax=Pyrobaculum sp. TaxID=2004705 RepID=UPI0031781CBC